MAHLPYTDVPLAELLSDPKQVLDPLLLTHSSSSSTLGHLPSTELIDLVLICRQGNDSQIAASALFSAMQNSELIETPRKVIVRDVRGGLYGWHRHVDPQFPIY
jgi:rhodanese-related sulfurtransferase